LTAKSVRDLVVRLIVKDHCPAVRATRGMKFGNLDRVGPTIVLKLGRVRECNPLDRLLPALATRPRERKLFDGFGHGQAPSEMSADDSDDRQCRAFLDKSNFNKQRLGSIFNINHGSVPEVILVLPSMSFFTSLFDIT